MEKNSFMTSKFKIFKDFRNGIFYEEIYARYEITEKTLIGILQRNIKGRYDYQRVLSSGLKGQKQFIRHLNSRWNPLKPDEPWESISPYLAVKKRVSDADE